MNRADALIDIGSDRGAASLGQLFVMLLGGFALRGGVRQRIGELVKFSTQDGDLHIDTGKGGLIGASRPVAVRHGFVVLAPRSFKQFL